ncbi:hypothetical protein E2C01_063775 [Portunus trituberculatus]|uniref:Uncharacterized protein n=1 Tax=Portunus trituberculatus TaxID=210409 RepID=A0A5B7HLG0_PORTR|nr:hypothetical protein [Portunus trituberculatus]
MKAMKKNVMKESDVTISCSDKEGEVRMLRKVKRAEYTSHRQHHHTPGSNTRGVQKACSPRQE